MTRQADDQDLADRFARLRREEREAAPAFAGVTARHAPPPERSRRMPFAIGLAAAVATIAIGVTVIRYEMKLRGTRAGPPVPDIRSARWAAPTDFLLDVPGGWLLRDLPRVAAPASIRFDSVTYRRILS